MSGPLIDVNVNLGQWPTRRAPLDTLSELVAKLSANGVVEAWAGSFDGIFHRDLAGANVRLADECRAQQQLRLVPFGAVDPLQATWEEEMQRCVETHGMPGIRLHPSYHGYDLDHPAFAKILQAAAERNIIVSLVALMEDERMMHPMMRVPNVKLAPLANLVARFEGLRVVLLNSAKGSFRAAPLDRLMQAGNVYVEIAMLEGVGGIENLLNEVPLERILFGSHSPSFYFESSLFKLRESNLADFQLRAISHENARRLLPLA